MKIMYQPKVFRARALKMIERANVLLEDYEQQGIKITLRSLYYRFVANGWLPNKQRAYKRLGKVIGNARLAGKIDWEHLEDRMRSLASLQHFSGAQDALDKLASWYHVDLWAGQQWRPEVWIEKDALSGVVAGVCDENDVPYFCCRGYTSLSEMWRASLRLRRWTDAGQKPYIIHFGDHDPSGIDMSRDIHMRLRKTFLSDCEFERVALNMDQIEKHKPPPNPAKVSDSRYKGYVAAFGDESWELDALEPKEFRKIIEAQLKVIRDDKPWNAAVKQKEVVRERLKEVSRDWERLPDLKRAAVELGDVKQRLEKAERELIDARKKKRKPKK